MATVGVKGLISSTDGSNTAEYGTQNQLIENWYQFTEMLNILQSVAASPSSALLVVSAAVPATGSASPPVSSELQ